MSIINIKTVNINIDSGKKDKAAKATQEALYRLHALRSFNPATDGTEIEPEERLPKSVRRYLGNLKHSAMG
jgi:hypothetical protein